MDRCLATTRAWSESVRGSVVVEHLVAIDAQDAESYDLYLKTSKSEGWFSGNHKAIIMDGTRLEVSDSGNTIQNMPKEGDDLSGFLTAVNKVNRLAEQASGDWLFFIADDFRPTTSDWLPLVVKYLEQWRLPHGGTDVVVASPERDDRQLINHPIMSRSFYRRQGYFFCPEYLHICVDSDLHYVASLANAIRQFPSEVHERFVHDNPYVTRDSKSWDKVYGIGNNVALYEQGSRTFAKRKEYLAKFGNKIDNDFDRVRRGFNIGCGAKPTPSTPDMVWTNMDSAAHRGVDIVRDIRRGFPFGDNTFDEILMDNVLEHFVSEDVIFLLNEIHRVARPGARVKIIVPHAHSQGAVQDPTHKSMFVPRSALYWNQHDTPYGGVRLGITANLRSKSVTITGDMGTEAFITFDLVAQK